MAKKIIYLDNAATTPVAQEVLKEMTPYFNSKFGNASSLHALGKEAKQALENSRKIIAKSINAKQSEIFFTSGGTESNNLAIKGTAFANKDRGNHIITTQIEHDCVLNACKWLETQGFHVTYLPVDKEGFVSLENIEKSVRRDTILVSIIHGNNEIGTIQNLEKIGKFCRERGIYFHTDACQSYTKVPIDVQKQSLDLVTINAHKIHGPKGVGALYIKEGTKIIPWAHGGGQEKGLRSGTENVSGIVGFAAASKLLTQKDVDKMTKLRDKLISRIEKIQGSKLNGPKGEKRLCNNINFTFEGVEGEAIGTYLDIEGICSSTASACSSRSLEPSHVLLALGLTADQAHGSLRLSISKYTKEQEINKALEVLENAIKKLRRMSPLDKLVDFVKKRIPK